MDERDFAAEARDEPGYTASSPTRPTTTADPVSAAPTYYTHSRGRVDESNGDGNEYDDENVEDPADLPLWIKTKKLLSGSLNFYRIHMLTFIFTPLIFSVIFWACNTEYEITYIDALFNCVSAMTVTGLAANNLSTLSGWQQTILFIQMLMGSITTVSLIMIMVRRHFFRQEFKHIIEGRRRARREKAAAERDSESGFGSGRLGRLSRSISRAGGGIGKSSTKEENEKKGGGGEVHTSKSTRDPDEMMRRLKGRLRWRDLFRHNIHKGDTFKDTSPGEKINGSDSSKNSSERQRETPTTVPVRPSAPTRNSSTREGSLAATEKKKKGLKRMKIRPDMIKRVEGGGSGLMNPMGWYNDERRASAHDWADEDVREQGHGELSSSPERVQASLAVEPGRGILDNSQQTNNTNTATEKRPSLAFGDLPSAALPIDSPDSMDRNDTGFAPSPQEETEQEGAPRRRLSEPAAHHPSAPLQLHEMEDRFPRSKTIAFDDDGDDDTPVHRQTYASARESRNGLGLPRTGTIRSSYGQSGGLPITRTMTGRASMSGAGRVVPRTSTQQSGGYGPPKVDEKYAHFGGFPSPLTLAKRTFAYVFPQTTEKLQRTMTMQRTFSEASMTDIGHGVKEVTWISFDAIVGRNSYFHDLTKDEYDELGGVEYRALGMLFWVVLIYWIGVQFIAFIIIAPYIAAGGRYDSVFQDQFRVVPIYWFAAFQSVSAFSNTGMSLVDTSMIPFSTAYLMIAIMIILIYAGNTAFPTFLRLTLWTLQKLTPRRSRTHETISFLLDHPRRCFVYLFPAKETWVLVLVMLLLTMIDFVSFMVLDIGNPVIESIPVGQRLADALMQSAAVRAAGFGIVPLAALAPAVKVLYVIMMYIAVYPISMTLRSTNVYEEQSLGIYGEEMPEEEEPTIEGRTAVLKYLGWHARRQLAWDIWWLAGSLWLVCIVERGAIDNDTENGFFSIFAILFELVSAYSTTGLSLGLADQNYSLSGDFRKLSKIILCVVMIRGRHRGLPVAIDRAVMLPKDFTVAEAQAFETEQHRLADREMRRTNTMGSMGGGYDAFSLARKQTRRGSMNLARAKSRPSFDGGSANTNTRPSPIIQTSQRSDSSPSAMRGVELGSVEPSNLDLDNARSSQDNARRSSFSAANGSESQPRTLTTIKEGTMSRSETVAAADEARNDVI